MGSADIKFRETESQIKHAATVEMEILQKETNDFCESFFWLICNVT